MFLKCFMNELVIKVISKLDFVNYIFYEKTDMRLICLFLTHFLRPDYCMMFWS